MSRDRPRQESDADDAMPRRYRRHANPFTLARLSGSGQLNLPLELPIEVDLGCGSGEFVISRALSQGGTFFVGLDLRKLAVAAGMRKIQQLELKNARLETRNLLVETAELFPRARIRRFFIHFPDPFFKRRQHSRQWLNRENLAYLVAALEVGGEIVLQSDVWKVAVDALMLFESIPELSNRAGEFSFWRRQRPFPMTKWERSCIDDGRKIWKLSFIRRGGLWGTGGVEGH